MLEIQDLTHIYRPGGANEILALDRVELQLGEAEFATLIGSNGAGKTTLFNVIAGVVLPDQGQIRIDGVDVTRQPEHSRAKLVGRVFQDPLAGTAAQMTIAENLALALARGRRLNLRAGVNPDRRRLFIRLLETLELGLEQRLDEPVSGLSGGQRQALTLLIGSMTQPKILLLDEHTTALDPATSQKILGLTQEIVTGQRLTTLMITHNMQQALDYGDRLLMMDRGRIVLDLKGEQKTGKSVQDLIDLFKEVKHEEILNDELLLND